MFCLKTSGTFTWIGVARTTMLASSPFLHMRLILVKFQMEKSSIFILNNFLFAITFFLFRIVPIVPIWKNFYSQIYKPEWDLLGYSNVSICVSAGIFDCLNIFWFYKILRIIFKVGRNELAPKSQHQKAL